MRLLSLLLLTLTPLLGCCSQAIANNPVRAPESNTEPLSFSDARHLAMRTGFGASPFEIVNLTGKTRQEAVAMIVEGLNSGTHTAPPAWVQNNAPHHHRFGSLSTADKQQFRKVRQNEVDSLRNWWVQEMISTPHPQRERLLLFWHNHFATAYSAIDNQAVSIARQHWMLRENAAGNFRALLKSIVHDPAMLNYLDNNNSKKQKPNENLARELMELFSLGEGNYTESDVKNAARALTGQSFSYVYDMRFIFKPWDHDKNEKTIFGKTGEFNADDLIDQILLQPAAARYIAAKFWRMLIGDIEQSDARLNQHAAVFRNADYDIKTLYKSLLLGDDFWDKNNRATLTRSPVSLTVGTIRSTGILPDDWQTLALWQQQMGQYLFEPPNVAGWPGGASWITPGRLLTRLEWLGKLDMQSTGDSPQPAPNMEMGTNGMSMISQDGSAMQAESTMQMQTAMSASGTTSMMSSPGASDAKPDQQLLSIRMASEEFDEHVQYRVKAHRKNRVHWDSGVLELTGGHDTRRMGRIDLRNLPWQTINFPVQIKAENITAIEVSFINDGATPDGADRNLYVSRASYGDTVWLPSDGIQTGKCPRKDPGRLYCTGTLRMEKTQTHSVATIDPPAADTIRASSVNVSYVQPPHRNPASELVFTLSDVELGNP